MDKTKAAGLTVTKLPKSIAFAEARLVIECRKLYMDEIKPENFLDKQIITKHYPKSDFHRLFIAEINSVYLKV